MTSPSPRKSSAIRGCYRPQCHAKPMHAARVNAKASFSSSSCVLKVVHPCGSRVFKELQTIGRLSCIPPVKLKWSSFMHLLCKNSSGKRFERQTLLEVKRHVVLWEHVEGSREGSSHLKDDKGAVGPWHVFAIHMASCKHTSLQHCASVQCN